MSESPSDLLRRSSHINVHAANRQAERHVAHHYHNPGGLNIWRGPFVDAKGQATPTFRCLLCIIGDWADANIEPLHTTLLELGKLASLGNLGGLPPDYNIGTNTVLCGFDSKMTPGSGLMTDFQAESFLSSLNITYSFSMGPKINQPRLALTMSSFEELMSLLLLANSKVMSRWIRQLVQEIATMTSSIWPSHTPYRIPRECFKADLLQQRKARYRFDAAIRSAMDQSNPAEEAVSSEPPASKKRWTATDQKFPLSTTIKEPPVPMPYEIAETDGKGYPFLHPQHTTTNDITPSGLQIVPQGQMNEPFMPNWLSAYGGRNTSMFEPGRLQQGEAETVWGALELNRR